MPDAFINDAVATPRSFGKVAAGALRAIRPGPGMVAARGTNTDAPATIVGRA